MSSYKCAQTFTDFAVFFAHSAYYRRETGDHFLCGSPIVILLFIFCSKSIDIFFTFPSIFFHILPLYCNHTEDKIAQQKILFLFHNLFHISRVPKTRTRPPFFNGAVRHRFFYLFYDLFIIPIFL